MKFRKNTFGDEILESVDGEPSKNHVNLKFSDKDGGAEDLFVLDVKIPFVILFFFFWLYLYCWKVKILGLLAFSDVFLDLVLIGLAVGLF